MFSSSFIHGCYFVENQTEVRHVQTSTKTFRRDGTNGFKAFLSGLKQMSSFKNRIRLILMMNFHLFFFSCKSCFSYYQVLVELDKDLHYNDVKQTLDTSNIPKKRRKNSPSPIALEPCYGNRAAVLSLLVKMPTGEERTLNNTIKSFNTLKLEMRMSNVLILLSLYP